MRRLSGVRLCIAALALTVAPPMASVTNAAVPGATDLPIEPGQNFTVPVSGIIAPSQAAGLNLVQAQVIIPGADYGLTYSNTDARSADRSQSGTLASIYISRNTAGDASLWFDWVSQIMDTMGYYGKTTNAPSALFTPKAHGVASGLIRTLKPSKSGLASTGVALFTHGDYIIKLRVSSGTLSPDENAAVIQTLVDALTLPALDKEDEQPALAYQVAACKDALPTTSMPKAKRGDGTQALVLGTAGQSASIMNSVVYQVRPGKSQWCRDPNAPNVYRPDGKTDRWMLVESDSYGIIGVAPMTLIGPKGYVVFIADPSGSTFFGLLAKTVDPKTLVDNADKLPPPMVGTDVNNLGEMSIILSSGAFGM